MSIVLKIIDIVQDEMIAKSREHRTIKIPKDKLPKYARVGDLIRHCEHGYFDVIDENGNLIYR